MQSAFLEEDSWEGFFADWLEFRAPRDRQTKELLPFTTPQAIRGIGYALRPGEEDRPVIASKADHMRTVACLKRLGYRNTTQRINGKVTRCWVTKSH